ncbi:hypothetical protein H5410_011330 [Solanum commersonii]|uniref:Helicase ATP-binding domain-containing protein n=1 Tax=Solanum commersonii TaxID=4109 RepID=A0A9J6AN84_SOLCO|nr:hypothetical protein H5410_011330 [Solanum commersonii]
MAGVYIIIYVCPETILRLIKLLQSLAESHGIALVAVHEVHCVSKWGHDFPSDYSQAKAAGKNIDKFSWYHWQLSVLRENFRMDTMKFLKFDIPIMALTASATTRVREDILQSLHMSKATKIVKHSKTSSLASYKMDFHDG